MYTANQIADWFISQIDLEKGDTISHLKLQKLVYYAQSWHYTILDEVLFDEPIQAWKRGPVIRSIYNRFKDILPYSAIDPNSLELDVPNFSEDTSNILNDIRQVYGELSGSHLEQLTHEEAPWLDARGDLPLYANCEKPIDLAVIKEFYGSKLNGEQSS